MNVPPSARPAEGLAPPPARRITVELTNICNLHCGYCVRDDDDLHHSPGRFFPADLMRKVLQGARLAYGPTYVSFTGGEVTLHPRFGDIIDAVVDEGMEFGFVTNGWHFDRVYEALLRRPESVRVVAFSLDGVTREAHDRWRGEGSFVRVVRAMARCHASGIKFALKVGIRRDTAQHLQEFALFGARLGASTLQFAHLLPTSAGIEAESALTPFERREAEEEIMLLANIFKMPVRLVPGYYNIDPAPPCDALEGTTSNVDFRGRLSLCCNLSGYRGAAGEPDVVGDLTVEEFSTAYERLLRVREEQNERRRRALAGAAERGREPDLDVGSPCLFCLHSFGKIPWRAAPSARSLPVIPAVL
jgi:MoaA/NifB/PqqE/SkfB family radical SAM enzyme